ncbi:MAG: SH3 domain-containing protein [Desulfurivibrionaceae bacterium]
MFGKQLTIGIALVFFLNGSALAASWVASSSTCNIRTYPNLNSTSNIMLRVPRYYPLKVQEKKDSFYRVQDYKTRTGWIHDSVVGDIQGVVVRKPIVNIRKEPGTNSDIVFKAKEGVTFKVLQKKGDWLKVQHESNRKGWIYKTLVWGI